MKRKQPQTSTEAWNSVRNTTMLSDHHNKILAALNSIKSGNYEDIARQVGFENANQCARRMKEMELKGLIMKNGEKKSTSSGRQAYVYVLVPQKKSVSPSDGKTITGIADELDEVEIIMELEEAEKNNNSTKGN